MYKCFMTKSQLQLGLDESDDGKHVAVSCPVFSENDPQCVYGVITSNTCIQDMRPLQEKSIRGLYDLKLSDLYGRISGSQVARFRG